VNCLRSLLDQHGAFLAKGATGQVPPMGQPGMNPPAKFDDGLMGAPGMAPGYAPGGPAMAPGSAAVGGEGGGPAAQAMSGNMINDGGHGANSGREYDKQKRAAAEEIAECERHNVREEKQMIIDQTNAPIVHVCDGTSNWRCDLYSLARKENNCN
jgi:hypothetical protein